MSEQELSSLKQLPILDANPAEHDGQPYVILDRGQGNPSGLIHAFDVARKVCELEAAGQHDIAKRMLLARDAVLRQFGMAPPATPS